MLQKANDEENVQQILSTLDSVNRLSKMNKGLILLTRIENDQYAGRQMLPLGQILRKHLEDLDFFISSREIKVHTDIDDSVNVKMNTHLAGILFTNLLSNAIKYNITGCDLYITLTKEGLTIANSGDPLTIPGQEVFDRFRKGDSPDSIGLGLAIVKKIIMHCDFTINYHYINHLHSFEIGFERVPVPQEELES
jgi:signal transduction histidine kinase